MIIYHETVDHDRNSSLGPIVLPGENRAVFVYILLKKNKTMHLTFNIIFFFSHKKTHCNDSNYEAGQTDEIKRRAVADCYFT